MSFEEAHIRQHEPPSYTALEARELLTYLAQHTDPICFRACCLQHEGYEYWEIQKKLDAPKHLKMNVSRYRKLLREQDPK